MKTSVLRWGAGLVVGVAAAAQAQEGARLYAERCSVCHDAALERAPPRETLASLTPERVLEALERGSMITMAVGLSADQRRLVSEFVAGEPLADASSALPPAAALCAADAPPLKLQGPTWSGWGADLANTRFRSAEAAGLRAADVPRLALKWAFAFPHEIRVYGHPALAGGRLFTGTESGNVYSLDASTGCVHWVRNVGAGVRTAVSVAEIETPEGRHSAAFFGDAAGFMHAVDADTGRPLWKVRVDDFPLATLTGSPVFYQGRLYVPVSSHEENAAASPDYECCRFRGSLVALDAATGAFVWKTYTVDVPHPTRKSAGGVQLWGPSGAPIWSSPAVDPARNAIYVTTGNNYSEPATDLSDAFVALDLDTGRILWSRQMTSSDVYTVACRLPDRTNCTEQSGPDFDFGASPILVSLPAGGGRALIAGQKSGVVHAVDPDQDGRIRWQVRIGRGGSLGGIQWGSAADAANVYVALSDLGRVPVANTGATEADPAVGGGMFALRLADGKRLWYTPPAGCPAARARCSPAQLAAVTALEGVVFSGSLDGHLRAYSTEDGSVIWDFDTVREYDSVDGVPGHGGSLDGPGPVVGGGMVFVNSGYPNAGGTPGNVLLAFSVDGK
ncbi:MAG TPA: PQQ-binding-like beta-propeller repeat protein [Gammaproteobacteria bacterium]|nr:PQQ-binding-like beta-propeller repeat protein [Gammaproteobacteria bacterium]